MSDDLDPQLLRRFAEAHSPLHDDGFRARVMARIEQPQGWRGIAHAAGAALRAFGSGLAMGVATPFRNRIGLGQLVTIVIGAIVSCLALLAA
jgi:hypothetical protein